MDLCRTAKGKQITGNLGKEEVEPEEDRPSVTWDMPVIFHPEVSKEMVRDIWTEVARQYTDAPTAENVERIMRAISDDVLEAVRSYVYAMCLTNGDAPDDALGHVLGTVTMHNRRARYYLDKIVWNKVSCTQVSYSVKAYDTSVHSIPEPVPLNL